MQRSSLCAKKHFLNEREKTSIARYRTTYLTNRNNVDN